MASRSRSSAGSARTSTRGNPSRSTRRAPQAVPKGAKRTTAKSQNGLRFRSGMTVRSALIATTLVAGGALAYYPVNDYLDLRGELQELEAEGEHLRSDLDEAHRNVRIAESRNAERARCYANYVLPGFESYSIPGSSGCVQ